MKTDQVLRHSLMVRGVHWLSALSGLILCFSGIGFMPLYGRFYVNTLPGMAWVSNFDIQLGLHYLSALVFTTAICFHLAYHLRRGEFAAIPRRGDLRESWLIIRAMLRGMPEPVHGKFLAEQRLAYAAIGLVSLLLVGSGLFLSFKNASPIVLSPIFIQIMTLLHMVTTFMFMALIAVHVAAFALKVNRPLLPSMLSGYVSREYARRRHTKWEV